MGSYAQRIFVKVGQCANSPILCKDISAFSPVSFRLNHLSTHHPLYEKAVSEYLQGGESDSPRLPKLTSESARRLANNLTDEDRSILLKEIQEIKGDEAIMKYQASLASLRWRSKIGRPSNLGESDPSGRYCVIPSNWLKQRLATSIPRPTMGQLIHLALFNSIPFIGFGFLDNVIMITAGDYIEASMGVALGISTMAAAALGNAVSDVAGIGSAFYVELIAMKLGIPAPRMTAEQQDLKMSHWFSNLGRAFGVAFGCLLGMFPLMFLPGHNKDTAVDGAEGATVVVPVVQAETIAATPTSDSAATAATSASVAPSSVTPITAASSATSAVTSATSTVTSSSAGAVTSPVVSPAPAEASLEGRIAAPQPSTGATVTDASRHASDRPPPNGDTK